MDFHVSLQIELGAANLSTHNIWTDQFGFFLLAALMDGLHVSVQIELCAETFSTQ